LIVIQFLVRESLFYNAYFTRKGSVFFMADRV